MKTGNKEMYAVHKAILGGGIHFVTGKECYVNGETIFDPCVPGSTSHQRAQN